MNSLLREYAGRRRLKRLNHPALVFACEPVEQRLLLASVGGTVFHDVNANGVKDLSEGLQSGFRIYVDENRNGVFDAGERSVFSDNFGNWRIHGLPAGEHIIRQQPRDGFVPIPSTPLSGGYRVVIPDDQAHLDGYDFGNFRYASASGRVFFDVNGNGREDGADAGMANVTVFIDANDNGILDPGELSKQTNANGEFRIDFVRPGFTRVRVIPPAGTRPSNTGDYGFVFPSNFGAKDLNFGLTDVGEIRGRVFSDLNGDTFQGRIEPGIAGRVVFLDFNGNGVLDAGEVSVQTNAMGDYVFRGLKPGRYRVQVVGSNDAEIVRPQTRGYALNLAPGQVRENINFAMAPRGGIRGVVFNDFNASGVRDVDEPGIANRRVYLDLNGNGIFDDGEPSYQTTATGEYRFMNLPSGRYFVDVVVPAGQFRTVPTPRHVIDVHAGRIVEGADFGLALQGYIAGTVFSDRNGNRAFEVDEPRLANRRVYIDANNDGNWNPGEISTMTNARGEYVLGGLNPGQYIVRTLPIVDAIQTKPADGAWTVNVQPGTVARNRDFGFAQFALLGGNVYIDANANGQRDSGEAPRANATLYLDLNANGVLDAGEPTTVTDANGAYFFSGLAPGVYHVRLETPAGFAMSQPTQGYYTVFALGGYSRFNLNFGLFQGATVSGVVYNDVNGDGSLDGGDTPIPSRRVFLDINGDGQWNFGEPSDQTNALGEYTISGVRPGNYRLGVVAGPNETVTEPPGRFYDISLNSGQTLSNHNFGLTLPASITGTVWEDRDSDGTRDAGEDGIAGQVVYIDANNNGVRDGNEDFVTTGADGSYTFTNLMPGNYLIRVDIAPDDEITDPVTGVRNIVVESGEDAVGADFGLARPASIGGVVYNDLNGNGTFDAGDTPRSGVTVWLDLNDDGDIDVGEPTETTDASGNYLFANVDPGNYVVRVDSGTLAITEPTDGFHTITITGGGANLNNNFGLSETSSIAGLVWDDLNGNGVRDGGEPGLTGETVFLDANENGMLDPDEQSVLTDGTGAYIFENLVPGTYTVRVDLDPGRSVSAPAAGEYVVTLLPDTPVVDRDFGVIDAITISGTVYNDEDESGAQNGAESGVAGRTVYLDLNGNEDHDAGEPSDITDAVGAYTITNAPAGNFNLRVVISSDERITQPATESYALNLTSGDTLTNQDFGLVLTGSIAGTVWQDLNGDGNRDVGEDGLGNEVVFLDLDGDGNLHPSERSVLTEPDGSFLFTNVPAGTYNVRVLIASGTITSPAGEFYEDVVVGSGASVTDLDFGVQP